MIYNLYNIFIYQPILNILIFFYKTAALYDFGLAIILSTLFIRLLLYPIFEKGARHQMMMQKIQPKLEKIKDTHKNNKEKQLEATMGVYKEHGINPFSGIFFLLIQIPVLIALFQIFNNKITPDVLKNIYSFVGAPDRFGTSFLGLINLNESNIVVVGLAAILQYFQGKMMLPKVEGRSPSPAEAMSRKMVYLAPALTLFIFWRLPAAISLYWATSTLFSIFQQEVISRKLKSNESR